MTQHTPHFNSSEFACRCGCGWNNIWLPVVWELERMRAWLNKHYPKPVCPQCRGRKHYAPGPPVNYPCDMGSGLTYIDCEACKGTGEQSSVEWGLFPTSGCRCPSHNKAVGGKPESWHLPRRIAEGNDVVFDPTFAWFKSGKKLLHFALATDFQVKRREKKECPNINFHENGIASPLCPDCQGKYFVFSSWTLDPIALKALWDFEKEIFYGGLAYYEQECGECDDGEVSGWTPGGDAPFQNTCPSCDGTGDNSFMHMDLGGKIWRG